MMVFISWFAMAVAAILLAEFGPFHEGCRPNNRERIVIYTLSFLFAPAMLAFVGIPNLCWWMEA